VAEIGAMRLHKMRAGVLFAPLLSLTLGGCSRIGAPSFVIFGAFFPDWMFCALLGIAVAVATRVAFVATGLSAVLPYQLFVCLSVGLIFAFLAWLLWFG
jgi:YtcA-like protein